MNYTLECELQDDGRWIAEVVELPGALAYGSTRDEASLKTEALAPRVIAERLESQESPAMGFSIELPVAA